MFSYGLEPGTSKVMLIQLWESTTFVPQNKLTSAMKDHCVYQRQTFIKGRVLLHTLCQT